MSGGKKEGNLANVLPIVHFWQETIYNKHNFHTVI